MSNLFRNIISNIYTNKTPYPQGDQREQAIDDMQEALLTSLWTNIEDGLPKVEGWYLYEYIHRGDFEYQVDYFFLNMGDNAWRNPIRYMLIPITGPEG